MAQRHFIHQGGSISRIRRSHIYIDYGSVRCASQIVPGLLRIATANMACSINGLALRLHIAIPHCRNEKREPAAYRLPACKSSSDLMPYFLRRQQLQQPLHQELQQQAERVQCGADRASLECRKRRWLIKRWSCCARSLLVLCSGSRHFGCQGGRSSLNSLNLRSLSLCNRCTIQVARVTACLFLSRIAQGPPPSSETRAARVACSCVRSSLPPFELGHEFRRRRRESICARVLKAGGLLSSQTIIDRTGRRTSKCASDVP
mmetsp:Transcript_44762/g.74252  ORF Transcript_44762/g.74252 Transcript_44762/m.74252 type:complete len:261 (+) Transcript_44762:120-902(+)